MLGKFLYFSVIHLYFYTVMNVTLADVVVQYVGGRGIEVRGYNNIVGGTAVRETGCGGIVLAGGDQVCTRSMISNYSLYRN